MADEDGSDAVCVRFSLTAAEYGAALRHLSWSLGGFKLSAAWIAVIVVYGVAVLVGSDVASLGHIPTVYAVFGTAVLAVGLVLALLLLSSLYLRPNREYRRDAAVRGEQGLCFSDLDITLSAVHGESRVQWGFFLRAIETRDLYLLRYRRRFGMIVPKRAFANPGDEARFRELVRGHLPVKFREKPRQDAGRGNTPISSKP